MDDAAAIAAGRTVVCSPTGMAVSTTVRFLSYNIFLRIRGVSNPDSNDDWKDARLDAFVRDVLPNFDVVCLQEAHAKPSLATAGRCARLIEGGRACGLVHHHRGPDPSVWGSRTFLDGGNLILSRYPFVETHAMVYANGCHADALAAKGALHALVAVDAARGAYLHVVSTHLQATYTFRPSALCGEVQRRQLVELRRFMATHCDGTSARGWRGPPRARFGAF